MLRLSDEQIEIANRLAEPIDRSLRDQYLRAIARLLDAEEIVGNHAVREAAAAAQHEVLNGKAWRGES
jgi:hypothetical protein